MMKRLGLGRMMVIAALLASASDSGWAAAGDPAGSEFQINTYTTRGQYSPAVGPDGAGGFVVAWQSREDGDSDGVFGQRFTSAGDPAGSEFQINTYTTRRQGYPAVGPDGAGGFVVAWGSTREDGDSDGVFGQRFTSAGAPAGSEFQINTYTTSTQYSPAVGPDGAGGFVVAWTSYGQDGSDYGVFGRRFTSAGTPAGSEFQINTYTTRNQRYPAVGPDGAGGFVVAWESFDQDGSGAGVFGQRFTSAGTPAGSEFQINTYTTRRQGAPAVGPDGASGFVVAWESYGQDGGPNNYGVFGQRFTSAGAPVGSEFQINTYTTSGQYFPAVGPDGAGGFVVAWESTSEDGDSAGVFGQRFTSAGAPAGSEFQINTYTTRGQYAPAVGPDGAGGFVVAWESYGQDGSGEGVFGQRFGGPAASGAAAPALGPWGLVLVIFLLAAAGSFSLRRRTGAPAGRKAG